MPHSPAGPPHSKDQNPPSASDSPSRAHRTARNLAEATAAASLTPFHLQGECPRAARPAYSALAPSSILVLKVRRKEGAYSRSLSIRARPHISRPAITLRGCSSIKEAGC